LSQTLVVHVIRTERVPFLQSRPSRALLATSVVICLVGAWLPLSPLSGALGFVGLPRMYWLILPFLLIVYLALAQALKGSSHAPSEHYFPLPHNRTMMSGSVRTPLSPAINANTSTRPAQGPPLTFARSSLSQRA
jgi:hypothetical protein